MSSSVSRQPNDMSRISRGFSQKPVHPPFSPSARVPSAFLEVDLGEVTPALLDQPVVQPPGRSGSDRFLETGDAFARREEPGVFTDGGRLYRHVDQTVHHLADNRWFGLGSGTP